MEVPEPGNSIAEVLLGVLTWQRCVGRLQKQTEQQRTARGSAQTRFLSRATMGLFMPPAELRVSKGADLVVELPELLQLDMMSSVLGRTKPARFRRSRIIWPLMLMSSGELEWRLWGKDTKSGKSTLQNCFQAHV